MSSHLSSPLLPPPSRSFSLLFLSFPFDLGDGGVATAHFVVMGSFFPLFRLLHRVGEDGCEGGNGDVLQATARAMMFPARWHLIHHGPNPRAPTIGMVDDEPLPTVSTAGCRHAAPHRRMPPSLLPTTPTSPPLAAVVGIHPFLLSCSLLFFSRPPHSRTMAGVGRQWPTRNRRRCPARSCNGGSSRKDWGSPSAPVSACAPPSPLQRLRRISTPLDERGRGER
jgi:hypothetical protein